MQILPLRLVFALVCMIAALSGCVVKPLTPDGAALKVDEGLVAFHVSSSQPVSLSYVDYSDSAFGGRSNELLWGPKGLLRLGALQQFVVIPLTQGDYMFGTIKRDNWASSLHAGNRFRVTARKITYLGHLQIDFHDHRSILRVYDQELAMREFLVKAYPAYFQSMDMQKESLELIQQ